MPRSSRAAAAPHRPQPGPPEPTCFISTIRSLLWGRTWGRHRPTTAEGTVCCGAEGTASRGAAEGTVSRRGERRLRWRRTRRITWTPRRGPCGRARPPTAEGTVSCGAQQRVSHWAGPRLRRQRTSGTGTDCRRRRRRLRRGAARAPGPPEPTCFISTIRSLLWGRTWGRHRPTTAEGTVCCGAEGTASHCAEATASRGAAEGTVSRRGERRLRWRRTRRITWTPRRGPCGRARPPTAEGTVSCGAQQRVSHWAGPRLRRRRTSGTGTDCRRRRRRLRRGAARAPAPNGALRDRSRGARAIVSPRCPPRPPRSPARPRAPAAPPTPSGTRRSMTTRAPSTGRFPPSPTRTRRRWRRPCSGSPCPCAVPTGPPSPVAPSAAAARHRPRRTLLPRAPRAPTAAAAAVHRHGRPQACRWAHGPRRTNPRCTERRAFGHPRPMPPPGPRRAGPTASADRRRLRMCGCPAPGAWRARPGPPRARGRPPPRGVRFERGARAWTHGMGGEAAPPPTTTSPHTLAQGRLRVGRAMVQLCLQRARACVCVSACSVFAVLRLHCYFQVSSPSTVP